MEEESVFVFLFYRGEKGGVELSKSAIEFLSSEEVVPSGIREDYPHGVLVLVTRRQSLQSSYESFDTLSEVFRRERYKIPEGVEKLNRVQNSLSDSVLLKIAALLNEKGADREMAERGVSERGSWLQSC